MYNELRHAVESILKDDEDFAKRHNGIGFNGTDSRFAHSVCSQPNWSAKQACAIYNMMIKYKEQLRTNHGVAFENIPHPEKEVEQVKESEPIDVDAVISSLTWGKPKSVFVKGVNKNVSNATPTEDFWKAWKLYKEDLKARGISLSQYNGEWKVAHWSEGSASVREEAKVVERVLPDISCGSYLLPFQVEHVRSLLFSINAYGSALDASDTGTGKTYTSLAICKELGLFPIVLTPKAVVPSFKRVMEKHYGIEGFVANYEQFKLGKTPFVSVTENVKSNGEKYKSFSWNIPANSLVIFDEVHRCKHYDTQNALMLISAHEAGVKVLCMSATSATSPMNLYAVGTVLSLFQNKAEYFKWMFAHGVSKGEYGLTFNGDRKHIKNIHDSIFPNHGSRIRISELGDAFPENAILPESYQIEDADSFDKVLEEMNDQLKDILAEEEEDSNGAAALTVMLRARQKTELLKVPTFVELAKDLLEEGNSVVIFTNYIATLEAIADKLGTDCIIRGGQSEKERQGHIDAFQRDEKNVIVCNIGAAREGISLHDINGNRPRVSLISPDWSAESLKQALGRIHRGGAKSKAIQKIVFAAGTIEEEICERLRGKLRNIDALNDGDLSYKSLFTNEKETIA